MADLTRFDFHALRFDQSECVARMTAEEVGQYILLLVKAWLMGKDATLPDDLPFLARVARVEEVSPIVLQKFPVIQTPFGPRRRNEVLYNEWLEAVGRNLSASESGKLGATIRWGNREAIGSLSGTHVGLHSSNQTNPNQTKPVYRAAESSSGTSGIWKFIASHFSSHFGFTPASREQDKQEYQKVCDTYGEDAVLSAFDKWAPENGWVREKKARFALKKFYDDLSILIDAEEITRQRDKENAVPAVVVPDFTELDRKRDAELAAKIAAEDAENAYAKAHEGEI